MKCPCGCGSDLSSEEEAAAKLSMFGNEDGFDDGLATIFGECQSHARRARGMFGIEQLRQHLAKLPEEKRDDLIDSAPQKLQKALEMGCEVNKRAKQILDDVDLFGKTAQIKYLSAIVKGFIFQYENSVNMIKNLRKEKKELCVVYEEQTFKVSKLLEQLEQVGQMNEHLHCQLKKAGDLLAETIKNFCDAQDAVARKDQEIAVLALIADSFAKLQESVIMISVSGNKTALLGEIKKIQAFAVEIQQKNNVSNPIAHVTLVASNGQKEASQELVGDVEQ